MTYNKLDKKIVICWRISRFIRLVITACILGVPTLILSGFEFFARAAKYVYLSEGIILFYLLITFILYPVIQYRQWGYIISNDRVEIKQGIFFIDTAIIPVIRIQHITITQGPILRKFGLSSVIIHTASGVFGIDGLSNNDARNISEALKLKLLTRFQIREKE